MDDFPRFRAFGCTEDFWNCYEMITCLKSWKECLDRSKNVRNRFLTKFYIDLDIRFFFKLKNFRWKTYFQKYFSVEKIFFSFFKGKNIFTLQNFKILFFSVFKIIFFIKKIEWEKNGLLSRCEILWRIHFSHSQGDKYFET